MLQSFLNNNRIAYEKDVQLKRKTWIKTGGVASYWIKPNSTTQLVELVKFLYVNNLSYEIVGSTSNLYFLNDYNPNTVISTLLVRNIEITEDTIVCDCGVQLSKLSSECVERGYKGFSKLGGIPGTVAAAIYGNSGYGKSSDEDTVTSHLLTISILTPSGEMIELSKKELCLLRRSSALKRKEIEGVIVSACFKIEKGEVKIEKEIADAMKHHRDLSIESPRLNLGSVYVIWDIKDNVINKLLSIVMRFAPKLIGRSRSTILRKEILLYIHNYRFLSPLNSTCKCN